MKLTEELKKKIDEAETLEEKKSILAETGVELTDDELEGVAGGSILKVYYHFFCNTCGCSEIILGYSAATAYELDHIQRFGEDHICKAWIMKTTI